MLIVYKWVTSRRPSGPHILDQTASCDGNRDESVTISGSAAPSINSIVACFVPNLEIWEGGSTPPPRCKTSSQTPRRPPALVSTPSFGRRISHIAIRISRPVTKSVYRYRKSRNVRGHTPCMRQKAGGIHHSMLVEYSKECEKCFPPHSSFTGSKRLLHTRIRDVLWTLQRVPSYASWH